jgi:hypothetical protein
MWTSVGGLPSARDGFSYSTHRLAVAGHHGKSAEVLQEVLGGDRLATNAGFREGDILGNLGVEVMTNHEHVEVLVDRVFRVWSRGIC